VRPSRIFRTTSFRLTLLYAALFGVSVAVLFAIIYWATAGAMSQGLDAAVETELAALRDEYRAAGERAVVAVIARRESPARRVRMSYLFDDARGRHLAGDLPPGSWHEGWYEIPVPESPRQEEHVEGASMRIKGMRLPGGHLLAVGQDTERLRETRELIVAAFGWAIVVTIVLALLGGAAISSAFLRRVEAIERTSRRIMDGDLSLRVPLQGTDDELDRLAAGLNRMLDRIQALMEDLRQVSNDIAHDLRTPLSRLRQRLESVQATARTADDYAAAVEAAVADVDGILGTFSALLRIAQIESGARRAGFIKIDLSELFSDIADAYGPVAEDNGQTLDAAVTPGISARGDRDLLAQMLANLVENALRYSPSGSTIRLCLEDTAQGPIGAVADSGPGIPESEREKVFQRFYRLDASRSTPGNGLGLSLVKAVAHLHGIEVRLTDNEPGLKVALKFRRATVDR